MYFYSIGKYSNLTFPGEMQLNDAIDNFLFVLWYCSKLNRITNQKYFLKLF